SAAGRHGRRNPCDPRENRRSSRRHRSKDPETRLGRVLVYGRAIGALCRQWPFHSSVLLPALRTNGPGRAGGAHAESGARIHRQDELSAVHTTDELANRRSFPCFAVPRPGALKAAWPVNGG